MPRRQRTTQPPADSTAEAIRSVRRGESTIAYAVLGREGPPVLLLQPFWVAIDDVRTDQATFGPQLAGSHQVIVHDRRGTGASERHPGTISTRTQVEDLLAILDDLAVERVMVVAMAESAPLALILAADHPERVARLALIDPQLRPRSGPGSSMLLQTLHSRPRVGLRAFARSLISDDVTADALAERMAGRMDAATAARLYEAFLQAEALPLARATAARTLLAFGIYDRLVVQSEVQDLHDRFANVQIGQVVAAPGTPGAAREAWIQTQNFLDSPPAADESELVARPILPPAPKPAPSASAMDDYVPQGPLRAAAIAVPTQLRSGAPSHLPGRIAPSSMLMRWSPPAQAPAEAVDLNRKAVDHILLGEIEQALVLFQRTMEVAPEYEEAAINYRELLSRLVARRVAQWETQQADQQSADSDRRNRARKRPRLTRLFRPMKNSA